MYNKAADRIRIDGINRLFNMSDNTNGACNELVAFALSKIKFIMSSS